MEHLQTNYDSKIDSTLKFSMLNCILVKNGVSIPFRLLCDPNRLFYSVLDFLRSGIELHLVSIDE